MAATKAERCWALAHHGEQKEVRKQRKLLTLANVHLYLDEKKAGYRYAALRTKKAQEGWVRQQLNSWKLRLPHLQKGLLRLGCFKNYKDNLLELLNAVIRQESAALLAAAQDADAAVRAQLLHEQENKEENKPISHEEENKSISHEDSGQVKDNEKEPEAEADNDDEEEVTWERCERVCGGSRCDKWRILESPFVRQNRRKFTCTSVGSSCREPCDHCDCRVCTCE